MRHWFSKTPSGTGPCVRWQGPIILLPVALAVVGLLTAAALATWHADQCQSASRRLVLHSHEVVETIQSTLSDVEDAETGQRGYLLTGSPRYLTPYLRGAKQAPLDLDRLQRLTRDNPAQQRCVSRLRLLVPSKLSELRQTVTLHNAGQSKTGLKIVRSDRGQQLMEDIRFQTAQMQKAQLSALTEQTAAMEAAAHLTLVSVSGALALVVALLGVAVWGVAALMTRQAEAEKRTRAVNAQLETVNAELEALATTDMLTGLRNRRAFEERLAEEFERAERHNTPLSLLLLDVDRFKQYNDTFGHLAGDDVLRTLGQVLRKAARGTDFPARYGGEEVVIILPQTSRSAALRAAERVRETVAAAPWERREVTASVGVSTLRPDMKSPAELVEAADRALYASKAAGRNCVTHECSTEPLPELVTA